jgi:hypothetical protein
VSRRSAWYRVATTNGRSQFEVDEVHDITNEYGVAELNVSMNYARAVQLT